MSSLSVSIRLMIQSAIVFIIISLSACASLQPAEEPWPESLPPKALFLDYYRQDPARRQAPAETDYLRWVRRFYQGWELYSRGWLQTTKELASTMPTVDEQLQVRQKMDKLGQRIAAEWAKDSDYRAINTRHLSIWANALNQAISEKQQMATLDKIENDVDQLLAGNLPPEKIDDKRYFAPPDVVEESNDIFS